MNNDTVSADEFVLNIFGKVTRIVSNETEVSDLEKVSKAVTEKNRATKNGRGSNLYVIDLVNPTHAFYDIINPSVPNPPDLQYKFNYGKFIEKKVARILSEDDRFVNEQGKVYGDHVGMPDVSGRIDFRIGDTLIEFKTSEQDVRNVDFLFSAKPHDLEQLLLYALFSKREKKDHRLLYFVGKHPNIKVRSFKVKIIEKDPIVSYFVQRRDSLREAIEKSDPSALGRCRYFDQLCKFKEGGICDCDGKEKIDTADLRKNVYIGETQNSWSGSIINSLRENIKVIGFWDLFQPRRWVLNELNPLEYIENDDDQSLENYWLRREIERKLLGEGIVVEHGIKNIPGFSGSALLYSTRRGNYKKFPLLVRVSDTRSLYPNNYHKAQIGAVCAAMNTEVGYIFHFFKNPQAGILWELSFNDLSGIRKALVKLIGEMVKLPRGDELRAVLPSCPDFLINRKCHGNCVCKAERQGIVG
ncbi:MAG: hypothetical protein ACP5OC_07845 [Thermoplasmata archaeon]